MFCRYCGTNNPREGAKFCTGCGKPLVAPPSFQPGQQPLPPQSPAPQQPHGAPQPRVTVPPRTQQPPVTQPPYGAQQPSVAQPPYGTQQPPVTQPPYGAQQPPVTQPPYGAQQPPVTQPPYGAQQPSVTQPPYGAQQPPVMQPPYGAQQPPVMQRPSKAPQPSAAQKKGSKAWIIVLVAALVLLFAVGGFLVWYFFLSDGAIGKSSTKDAESDTGSRTTTSAVESTASDAAASGAQSAAATPTPEPTEEPGKEGLLVQDVPSAVASDSQVVLRNARADATLTANGAKIPFTYVGQDLVVARSDMPDLAQVRIVAPVSGGTWQTANVWYNYRYGNDMKFGDVSDYGAYEASTEDGEAQPSFKTLDVLTWAYYRSFLQCINDQSMSGMNYSTSENTQREKEHVFSNENAKNTYNVDDFSAVCDEGSISYQADGSVLYNAAIRCNSTTRSTGAVQEIRNYRTVEATWDGGMWKVNKIVFLSEDDYQNRRYADLP